MASQTHRPGAGAAISRAWARTGLAAVLVSAIGALPATAQEPVRVWEGVLQLPTYEEGAPDPNPPFDFLRPTRINYPYTIRDNLTDRRSSRPWRALFLENEYLRCSVLPDLGGHLYSCTDRLSGEEMFYANGSIKLSQIGYRGAWAALGVEFNFPVSHNWVSTSPVDFAYRSDPDGSASIWVGNIDRVHRTDWRVRLTLRPGRAVLEQRTVLYNQSDIRHRYYWWTNAAVRVTDTSWILYPQRFSASHGFTDVDTWPVDRRGTDNSVVGNHAFGPVSRFSHGSREPFMAVYHPDRETGVAHVSSPTDLPAKKIWSWGRDARGLDWREALSDDSSAYVEIQAGLFRDQETYGYLEPQSDVRFTELWIPLRGLGGLSRVSPDGALHMCRVDACGAGPAPGLEHRGTGPLRVRLTVTRRVASAELRILEGTEVLLSERLDLEPEAVLDRSFPELHGTAPYTVVVTEAGGADILRHTEGEYDLTPSERISTGAQPVWEPPPPSERTADDWLLAGDALERNGRRAEAWEHYGRALAAHPTSHGLQRARGILAAGLGRHTDADTLLAPVIGRVSNDAEALYYHGLALVGLGREDAARLRLEAALPDTRFRSAANLALAELEARAGRLGTALGRVADALTGSPRATRLGLVEIALLRAADRQGDALARADRWRALDPSHSGLRWEAVRLGAHDPELAGHLAADPERVLEIAAQYLRLGLYGEAEILLSQSFPEVDPGTREPGQVGPDDHPLVAYYLAFVRQRLGADPSADFARARSAPLVYVFPNRQETVAVLEAAMENDPTDAGAMALLGQLALARLDAAAAIDLWRAAIGLRPGLPAAHRNLGRTLLAAGADAMESVTVLRAGTEHDPDNVGVYEALDDALAAAGRGPGERADALLGYPDLGGMPARLVYRTVRRLVEAGRFDRAEGLLRGRYFPREEGGTNVREIYLEARVARAAAAAADGRCQDARAVLDRLLDPVPDLDFTRSGLDLWLVRSGLEDRVREVGVACPPDVLGPGRDASAPGDPGARTVLEAIIPHREPST